MDEALVKQVIAKANKGGFKWFKSKEICKVMTDATFYNLIFVLHGDQGLYYGFADVVFSHEFAEAFWGVGDFNKPYWQFQLQQMVLEKDYLKYLATFL